MSHVGGVGGAWVLNLRCGVCGALMGTVALPHPARPLTVPDVLAPALRAAIAYGQRRGTVSDATQEMIALAQSGDYRAMWPHVARAIQECTRILCADCNTVPAPRPSALVS